MKVTMLLADSAQAVGGKLYILGGGWSTTGPEPAVMALAIKIEVPWDQANRRHAMTLSLQTADGQPVKVATPLGDQPVELKNEFEVGRPAGLKPGTPLDLPIAINLPPIPLSPDSVYVWRLTIDDQTHDDWALSFTTRPAVSGSSHPPVAGRG